MLPQERMTGRGPNCALFQVGYKATVCKSHSWDLLRFSAEVGCHQSEYQDRLVVMAE